MLSNLKSFFKERQIDISDVIETIKAEKRMSGRSDRSNEKSLGSLALFSTENRRNSLDHQIQKTQS